MNVEREERGDGSASLPAGPSFPPEELHWAEYGWAKVAPGLGGWKVLTQVRTADESQTLLVAPPTLLPDRWGGPKYVLSAMAGGGVVVSTDMPGKQPQEIGRYASLGEALHSICALTPAQETAADALAASATQLFARF